MRVHFSLEIVPQKDSRQVATYLVKACRIRRILALIRQMLDDFADGGQQVG